MPVPTYPSSIELGLSITCGDSFNDLHPTDVSAAFTFVMSLTSAMMKQSLSTLISTAATVAVAGSCG